MSWLRYTFQSMNTPKLLLAVPVLLGLVVAGCSSGGSCAPAPLAAPASEAPAGDEEEEDLPVLVGEVTREQVELAVPDWVQAEVRSEIDAEAAQQLALVSADHEIEIYFGTWCSDSKRELARFWRALDETGSMVPFPVELVAVDREKAEPADRLHGMDLQFVPTFIVRKGGEEVGRIIEESPAGIENDLLSLLTGRASGVLSASQPHLVTQGGGDS